MHKRISIGINGSMLDEKPTGVGIYSFNLINNLFDIDASDNSIDYTVFTASDTFLNKEIKTFRLPKYLLASRYGKIAAASRFLWNTFYYPFHARHFDLLINPTTHGSLMLGNQIFTIHDLISLRYNNISKHQRFYFKNVLPRYIKKAKLIIAVSESTKNDIIHFYDCEPGKIKVIYNGYDDSLFFYDDNFTFTIREHYGLSNYILAIGPSYPHKNFELLLKVYSELGADYQKTHPLVIVGGLKKYVASLKKLAASLEIQEQVFFLDYVPIHLMPYLYREANFFVFPSLYEGFGIPLLEAMASGCPVIASNTSSVPEVCGNAVLYFDPLQASSLKSAILKLNNNDKVRDALIEAGLKQCKKFSWMKMAKEFNTIIESYTYKSNMQGSALIQTTPTYGASS